MIRKYMLLFALLILTTFIVTGCRSPIRDQSQFKDEGGGSGIAGDGNRFSFHGYQSKDGVAVSTYIEDFRSPELARKVFEAKITEGLIVFARGPRLDRNGKSIGERVVLTMKSKAEGETQSDSYIFWTTDARLHWIQSKSLRHALALEKTFYPNSSY
jgi:hypothetical protein